MRKVLLIIVIVAGLAAAIIYREEIVDVAQFFYYRPYDGLSNLELENQLRAADSDLNRLDRHAARLTDPSSRPELGDAAAGRDLVTQGKQLLERRHQLRMEQVWREKRAGYFFLAGFILFLVVFLALLRRLLNDRAWANRRGGTILARPTSGSLPGPGQPLPADLARQLDPRVRNLIPGSSNRQEVINLLGEPDLRTIFIELEAWTYYLPRRPESSAGPAADPLISDSFPGGDPAPALAGATNGRENRPSLTVIFKGNLVHDLSLETIGDRKDMRRIL